jgi:cell division protein FtsA
MLSNALSRAAELYAGERSTKAVLDIGTSKVTCFIAEIEPGAVDGHGAEIIGVGHQASAGIGEGGLLELHADYAIRSAIEKAERMAGTQVKSVSVAISGRHLVTRRIAVDLTIGGHAVMEEDLAACFKEAAKLAADEGLEPLHMWPASFKLDDIGGVQDPRGMTCQTLTVEIVSLAASRTAMDNISTALERCQLKPSEFIATPYASALATLYEEEISLGVLCLDIGAKLTGFSVFKGGSLIFAGAVPIGSAHITQDIATAFGVSLEAAERAKTLHGTAFCAPGDDLRFIELKTNSDEGKKQISVTQLAEVIGPRLEEIVRLVLLKINDSGLRSLGLRRAVVTGGGSQLHGTQALLEHLFGLTTRIGRPLNMFGAPEMVSGAAFAATAGMVDHVSGMTEDPQWGAARGLAASLTPIPAVQAETLAGGTIGKAAQWLRAHF